MTLGAGFLLLLDGRPSPRLDGLTLVPMISQTGGDSIDAIFNTRSDLRHDRWRAIVVHHSGSPVGTPADLELRRRSGARAAYHFILGNGRGMDDGEIHVTFRWLDQRPADHTRGPDADWFRDHAIGICLIGDGNRRAFTDTQIRRLSELVNALARELEIPAERVVLHSDLAGVSSPGRFFPGAAFRESLNVPR
jgi:N-acetyl-anhydromuramyl-L-alanine amidase AmpD